MAALRRGDEKAFEAIYDRYHRALLAFCRHMLGSHEEAEDALQRVFVSAHRHLSDGSEHVNLKPWLYTIARNRCLSMLRARRETLALDDVGEPSCSGLALAEEVELGEDLKEMLGDLARLPDDQRAALVLAELGDLSQQEIAATLDVRTDKVKALIFQAREALAGWRQAHAASCHEICEQLATLNGSALRRAPIRRHLAVCPTCTAFEGEVKRQRAALGLLLPVVPGVALKHSVLTAALSAGPGAAATGAGGAVAVGTAAGASGFGAKALVVAVLATGAAGGGVVTVRELEPAKPVTRPAATTPARSPAAAPRPARRRKVAGLASPRDRRGGPRQPIPRVGRSGAERASAPVDVPSRPRPAAGSAQPHAQPPAGSGRRRAKRSRRPRSRPRPRRPARPPRRLNARSPSSPSRGAQGQAAGRRGKAPARP